MKDDNIIVGPTIINDFNIVTLALTHLVSDFTCDVDVFSRLFNDQGLVSFLCVH